MVIFQHFKCFYKEGIHHKECKEWALLCPTLLNFIWNNYIGKFCNNSIHYFKLLKTPISCLDLSSLSSFI